MTKFIEVSALIASCIGTAALFASPVPAGQSAAAPELIAASAAVTGDDDMAIPDDAATPDQTPEASNADAPDPVLPAEPSDTAAPAAEPVADPPSA